MFHISKVAIAAALAAGNSGVTQQSEFVMNSRSAAYNNDAYLAERIGEQPLFAANAARTHADVWRDFDTTTRMLMIGDEGSGILADLEPLARNVNIGKLVSEYRQFGENEMEVRSSLDGNHAKPVNRGNYQYDGALVLVHSTQVGIQWRERAAGLSENYDQLRDDQETAVRYVRRRMVDNFINGSPDITYKGYRSFGIKNNPHTLALNLGAAGLNVDLTSAATTWDKYRGAFVSALQALQGNGNNAVGNVTFYVSDAVWFNGMRIANPDVSSVETIMDNVLRIPGVAAVKRSDQLTGNEFIAMILSSEYVRPIIGMPVTNTPIPRVTPMDDWNVLVWSASGLQIKADAAGRAGVLYARNAG